MAAIIVGGGVVNVATGTGVGGARVEMWGQGLPKPFAMADTVATGEFRAAIGDEKEVIQAFGDHARVIEFRVSKDGKPLTIKEGATLTANSLQLKAIIKVEMALAPIPPVPDPGPVVPDGPSDGGLAVHGVVRQVAGQPAVGVRVTAYDQDMRGRSALGSATTDGDGTYSISYSDKDVIGAESGTADLVFTAIDAQGAEVKITGVTTYDAQGRPWVLEGPVFNVPSDVRVDLNVDSIPSGGLSEFERLEALLQPLRQEVAASDLTDDDTAFLAGDTGVAQRFINLYAAASRMGRDMKLPSASFYGLGREGLPLNIHVLAQHSADEFQRALAKAILDQIIPQALGDGLEALAKSLAAAVTAPALETPVTAGVPSLSSILGVAGVPQEAHVAFLASYASHAGTTEEFWNDLKGNAAFQAGATERIQQALQLTVLTRGHVTLTQKMQVIVQQQNPPTLRALAQFDATDWLKMIGEASDVPAAINGKTDAEKCTNYAIALETEIDQAFPTAALARRLTKEGAKENADIAQFLGANRDFEFDQTHVDSFLAARPAALSSTTDKVATANRLKVLQRLFTITPDYSEIGVLSKAGVTSAQTAARMGPMAFVARFASTLGDEGRALELYDRSARIASIAASVYVKFSPEVNAVDFQATRRPS